MSYASLPTEVRETAEPDTTPADWPERLVGPYRDSLERRRYLFTYKCLMVARDLETCEALMRGEKVPRSRLRPEWAKAYGY